MAALTASRYVEQHTTEVLARVVKRPVKASTKIWQGAMTGLDSSGNALPAALAATTVWCEGVAKDTADNSSGAAGDINVVIERGIFPMNNSSAGDAIGNGDIGKLCYVVDDNTVALTSATSTRIVAGRIAGLKGTQVLVEFGIHNR